MTYLILFLIYENFAYMYVRMCTTYVSDTLGDQNRSVRSLGI